MKRKVLILSGGGGALSYQLGAVSQYYAQGHRPDLIIGVSAGAIVGAMAATPRAQKEPITFFQELKDLMTKARPWNAYKILREAISEHSYKPVPEVWIQATNISTLKRVAFPYGFMASFEDWEKLIFASAANPIFGAKAQEVKTQNGLIFGGLVDGGVLDHIPTLAAIKAKVSSRDHITVVGTRRLPKPRLPRTLLGQQLRMIKGFLGPGVIDDLAILDGYKYTLVLPTQKLPSKLAWGKTVVERNFDLGAQDFVSASKSGTTFF